MMTYRMPPLPRHRRRPIQAPLSSILMVDCALCCVAAVAVLFLSLFLSKTLLVSSPRVSLTTATTTTKLYFSLISIDGHSSTASASPEIDNDGTLHTLVASLACYIKRLG